MASPVPEGSELSFFFQPRPDASPTGTIIYGAFARPEGGYALLAGKANGGTTSLSIQSYGADGVALEATPTEIGLAAKPVAIADLRLDNSILFGNVSSGGIAGQADQRIEISRIGADGSVSPVYAAALTPTTNSFAVPEVAFAASQIDNDIALVRNIEVGGVPHRVVELLDANNAVRVQTTIDTDLSNDAGVDVLGLDDGRYLVTWSEYNYTAGPNPVGLRPYDRIDVRAILVDGAGKPLGQTTTLASAYGEDNGSFRNLSVDYELDALQGGEFAFDLEVKQTEYTQTRISYTLSTQWSDTIGFWSADASGLTRSTLHSSDFGTYQFSSVVTNRGIGVSGKYTSRSVAVLDDGEILSVSYEQNFATGIVTTTGRLVEADGQQIGSEFSLGEMQVYPNTFDNYRLFVLEDRQFVSDIKSDDLTGNAIKNDREYLQLYRLPFPSKDFSGRTAICVSTFPPGASRTSAAGSGRRTSQGSATP